MNVLTKVVTKHLNTKEVSTNILESILVKDHTSAIIKVVSNPSLRFPILKGIK